MLFSSTGTWFGVGIRRRSLWAAAALIIWSEVWEPLNTQRTSNHSIKKLFGAFKKSILMVKPQLIGGPVCQSCHTSQVNISQIHSQPLRPDDQQYLQVLKRREYTGGIKNVTSLYWKGYGRVYGSQSFAAVFYWHFPGCTPEILVPWADITGRTGDLVLGKTMSCPLQYIIVNITV